MEQVGIACAWSRKSNGFKYHAGMDTPLNTEQQLIADVEQLRTKYSNTQDLYREVCAVMFFRYGMTPTANKLYQYVKKGSMTAPSEALSKFWENLREKSRVRIERPDLPEEIRTSAGELAASLWDLAQNKARASLHEYEAEAMASVLEAKSALAAAQNERSSVQNQNEKIEAHLAQVRAELAELQQKLAAEAATRLMLDEQLEKAQTDIAAHRQAHESARQYFATEMDKLRVEAQLAEERFRASEKRALLEIDRERNAAAKLDKELAAVRAEASRAAEQARLEMQALHQQLGDTRQQVGTLEGQWQAARTNAERLSLELQAMQQQMTESAVRAASSESDRDGWRLRAENAEKTLHELKKQTARKKATVKNPS